MPNRIWRVLVSFALIAAFITQAAREGEAGTEPVSTHSAAVTESMQTFVATLDPEQRERALYEFDDDERFDLRLAPLGLEGLRLDAMTDSQSTALRAAFLTVLSEEGLEKTDVIRSLEVEVAELESGLFGLLMDRIRKVGRYFLAVFGEPGTDAPWGLRFDGHHLSLNWTAVPGQPVSATPVFMGGQPREVPSGLERAGLRVLAAEEDRAIDLIDTLDEAQRDRARIQFVQGSAFRRPMFVGDAAQLELEAPVGIPIVELGSEARARFDQLIAVHLANFTEAIGTRHRARLETELESLRFAYAVMEDGSNAAPRAGDPLYYRIQSNGFLVEFDDTSAEADHIHVVIRSVDGDFGRDLLEEHYSAAH